MYTTTHFKPWPLTSTCNWRNSSKWQDALAGLGPVETRLPATVTVTTVAFTSAQGAVLCRHPSHPVSHLSPICSGLERAGLLHLPNENGFRVAVAGISQILNRKVAKWKDHGLSAGLLSKFSCCCQSPSGLVLTLWWLEPLTWISCVLVSFSVEWGW